MDWSQTLREDASQLVSCPQFIEICTPAIGRQ